ncbi:MAG: hypothetical protein Q4Q58_06080 [Thermoplasmata archaeon]|nr:hypothetical protein [Thermoplasmata archaeon]
MSLFDKREQVYGPETLSVGDFDPTVDGCYRNVVTIPLTVRPRRVLRVKVSSDHPVDVVVAREDRSSAGHRDGVMEAVLGPFDTGKSSSMGILLGVYKGDKAKVTVEAWTDRE